MKFHLISETIDGSIKDIVQLKTLDSSLEYSQMFDALEDCPKDFQAKLIQALNSVGETIQVSPVDVFNIVLCASNEEDDKDVTKKMYNWWKAVFEILSKCDIPDDRKAEYDDLVDTLMAEVSKAGDDARVNESEEYGYEQANIEDEEVMLNDMEFAISKIGEIANRTHDLINFVNPYCESTNGNVIDISDVRREYLLGNISDDDMQAMILNSNFYDDVKDDFIRLLTNQKKEMLEYVALIHSGDETAKSKLRNMLARLKVVGGTEFDNWWNDKCPLNKHNEFNEDNMMKFKKIDESGKRFGCRTSALTNHRTNEIKKMYISGRISEDEAFEQLSGIGRDDSIAEMLIDRWNSDYGINESNENELSNEMVEVTYYLPEDYKDDPNDDSWITTKETLGEICGDWFDGNFNTEQKEGELVYRVSGPDGYNYFKFDNPEDEEKFLEYAEMLRGGTVDESGDSEEIDSPSEGGSYRIEPDINDFDDTVFSVYFKTYEEDEWEYQETFNTTEEALAWIDEQIAYGEEHPIVTEANDGEWVDMDDLIGVPQTDPEDDASLKTEGFSNFNDDGEDPIISYEDEDGNHSVMVVTGHDEMGEMVYQVKVDEEEWTTTSNLEEAKMEAEKLVGKINKRPDADYQLMPVEVMESIDDAPVPVDVYDIEWDFDDDEEEDFADLPTEVTVDIPMGVIKDGAWAVDEYISNYLSDEYGFTHNGFEYDKSEVMKYNDNPWRELPSKEDIEAMDLGLVDAKDILPKRLQKADEANVVQDVTDVWALLKVLEDDEAAKNLKDLIDSHVRSEEEIMDAVDELYPEDVTQTELNNVFATGMEDIVDALGLDVNAYVKDGSFVDLSKPSTIAAEGDEEAKPEEVNGDEKKFKGDDGEVKTLDNANKKVVSEMTIEQDINSAEQLERILWGQGRENFIELVSKYGADEVMSVLEDSGITNLTQMNDYLWFEMESIEEMLGGSPDDEDEEF